MNFRKEGDMTFPILIPLDVCALSSTQRKILVNLILNQTKLYFLATLLNSKAFRVYNSKSLVVEESINAKFDDRTTNSDLASLEEDFAYINLNEHLGGPSSNKPPSSDKSSSSNKKHSLLNMDSPHHTHRLRDHCQKKLLWMMEQNLYKTRDTKPIIY